MHIFNVPSRVRSAFVHRACECFSRAQVNAVFIQQTMKVAQADQELIIKQRLSHLIWQVDIKQQHVTSVGYFFGELWMCYLYIPGLFNSIPNVASLSLSIAGP